MRIVDLVAIAFAVFLALPSQAADQVVLGKSFVVKDPAPEVDPSRRSVIVKGREAASDDTIVGNPLVDGATVELIANGDFQAVQAIALPAGPSWTAQGNPVVRYTYKDRLGVNGPVKAALMQRHASGTFTLQVTVSGAGLSVLPPAPGTDGGMQFTINGGDTYCVAFGRAAGGIVTNKSVLKSGSLQHKLFKIRSGAVPTTEAGCPSPRVTDNSDGTVTDHQTGLQWELKTGTPESPPAPGALHDVNLRYSWAGCCGSCNPSSNQCDCTATSGSYCQPNAAAESACKTQTPSGQWASGGCTQCGSGTCNFPVGATTTVWDWLSQVNGTNFAGHNDWRLPSEDGCNVSNDNTTLPHCPPPSELESIYPSSIFAPTLTSSYCSATTVATSVNEAWHRVFGTRSSNSSFLFSGDKTVALPVRAVR